MSLPRLSPRRILKPRGGGGFRLIETGEERRCRERQGNVADMNSSRHENQLSSDRLKRNDQEKKRRGWRGRISHSGKVVHRQEVCHEPGASRIWDRCTGASRSTSERPSSSTRDRADHTTNRSFPLEVKKGLGRKPSKKWLAFLKKQEEAHGRIKVQAKTIWMRMDFPTADCPLYPECGMSDGAAAAAKSGRQCTMGSFACGSNQTRKALRDHERSARLKGDVALEEDRLREYPDARRRYMRLASELQNSKACTQAETCRWKCYGVSFN